MSNIADVELSQLKLLQLIFETRNLTRAGEHAGLTQSAVSHTLKKLRYSFNDSLVIRQGNTLVLTPRAESMQAPLKRWLNDFDRNIRYQEAFEPSTSDRTFTIATSDLVEQILAPPLVRHLNAVAPDIHLVFSKLDRFGLANQIKSGEADFAISVAESTDPSLMVRALYRDDFVSLVRTGHPYLQTDGGVEDFCNYSHVLAGTGRDSRGSVDDSLEEVGFARDVQFKVANFSSAPYIAEASDVILTAPRKFVALIADRFDITTFEPPISHPGYTMKLYWDIKYKDDDASSWLREQLALLEHHY